MIDSKIQIFFVANTHFNTHFLNRPGRLIVEQNQFIKQIWNENIKEGDLVYFLGATGDYEFLRELNGNKIVLTGNDENKQFYKDLSDAKIISSYLPGKLYELYLDENRSAILSYNYLESWKEKNILIYGNKVMNAKNNSFCCDFQDNFMIPFRFPNLIEVR